MKQKKKQTKKHLKVKACLFAVVFMIAQLANFPAPRQTTVLADEGQATSRANTVTNIQDGVTLHCWNWSYKNIEANMQLIAGQGFTAIQTSPIQQPKESTKNKPFGNWWVLYQPMGFHIDNTGNSALGTKAEFVSMCNTAHKYGIKVIVDVVANHLGNAKGNDLSSAIIDDIKSDPSCWHDYSKNISDYSKRYDVTQYCISGLPDLNTASDKVQKYVLSFLKECIDAGADGFRFDTAKHIETPDDTAYGCASDFWPTVINGAKSYAKSTRGIDLYCYGEILDSPGGSLSISSYTKYMSVTDNSWGDTLRSNVSKGNASGYSYMYHKDASAGQLVVWAESHDTYGNNDGASHNTSVQVINKTWALAASRKDAMGLYLARPGSMSSTLGSASITGWSYDEVRAVNNFHNAFIGQSEYLANENGIAYCERGTSGVVLVNCSGTSASVNVTAHNIKDGTYVDQITGSTFTVSGGKIKGTIGSTGVAVVYGSGKTDAGSSQTGSNIAYIDLPSGWGSKVYCYVYDGITEETNNGQWPGVQMTHVAGNIYKYQVPSDIQSPLVIFYSSDKYRYPADMEPGLSLRGSMIYQGGEWKNYKEASYGTVIVKYQDKNGNAIADSVTMSGETGTSYSISDKNITGYTFSQVVGSTSGKYTDGTITVTYVYSKNSGTSSSGDTKETTTQKENTEESNSTTAGSGDTTEMSTDSNADTENQSTSSGENEESGSDVGVTDDENSDESLTSGKSDKDGSKDKDDEGGFPWVVIILPIIVAGSGAGAFAWLKYKKKSDLNE